MSTEAFRERARDYMRLVRSGAIAQEPRFGSRRRRRRRVPVGVVFRPLEDIRAGHCVFCGLETANADQVCNVCHYELEEAS